MLLITTSILPSLKMSPNAAPRPTRDHRQPGSFDRGHQLKLAIAQIVVEQRALGIALSPLRMLVHLRDRHGRSQ